MSKFNQTPPESIEEPDDWKAVPEADTKLYRAKVVFDESDIEGFTFPHGIVKSGDRTIGWVTGFTQGLGQCTIELTLDYASPERLEIENGQLYAKCERNTIILTKKKYVMPLVTAL